MFSYNLYLSFPLPLCQHKVRQLCFSCCHWLSNSFVFYELLSGTHKNITKLRINYVTSRVKKKGMWGREKILFYHKELPANIKWYKMMIFIVLTWNQIFIWEYIFLLHIQHSLVGLILISWEQAPASQLYHLHTITSIWFRFITIWIPGVQNRYSITTELQHFPLFIKMNLFLKSIYSNPVWPI